jgi:monoamine oxidase
MAHSRLFEQLRRIIRVADLCEREGLSTRDGLARAEELAERRRLTRRSVLKGAAVAAVAATASRSANAQSAAPRIAIIGGGLAGMAAADRLRAKGYSAVVYEASTRAGGRSRSIRGVFPGQVVEAGGELIDNLHKTMLAYANEFNLAKEDLEKEPGENAFFFDGRRWSEEAVIDEYRQIVPRIHDDLQASTGAPTFFAHNAGDVALDNTDLATWLETRGAGLPLIQNVLEQAYIAEYGLECHEQSSLNMLLFIHADRKSKLREFGQFSDERYHLVGGNDAVASNIRARLPGPVLFGAEVVRLGKNTSGKFEIWLRGAATPERADAVIVTLPFSVLRNVTLDASLGLSPDKRRAIATLGYGNNCKAMIGFNGQPWRDQGFNGLAYTGLPNVQNTWESSYTLASTTSVLTDYAGGDRGRSLQLPIPSANQVQAQADAFLTDVDRVWPGTRARATRSGGKYVVAQGHWLSNPFARGAYTCYLPGQFTGLAELESRPAGALKFAGEHADSFYAWQGFMEGACLSGIRAADEVLDDIKSGRI